MARKRMIDPAIWESEDFAKLSCFARLVWIGLFSIADDEGRGKANAAYLKSHLFTYDDTLTTKDVDSALMEIGNKMSIRFYEVDGKRYYQLTKWDKFQTINKPTPSQIPAEIVTENTNKVAVTEDYCSTTVEVVEECGLKEIEEKGKEIEKEEKEEIQTRDKPARSFVKFVKPTLEEVKRYCKQRNNNVNPQGFIDFYESKGWKVGNQPMKDWQAAVRTWENRNNQSKAAPPGTKVADGKKYNRED